MRILYISSLCAQDKFDSIVSKNKSGFTFQNQKFHHLLTSGLSTIEDVSIDIISTYPVGNDINFVKYEEEQEGLCHYIYPSYINFPLIHRFGRYIGTKKAIKKCLNKDTIIVCNVLDYDQCLAAQSIKTKYPYVKIVGIVTDIPGYTSGASFSHSNKIKSLFSSVLLEKYKKTLFNYDAYLFLSEPMNNILNKDNKPFCVIEGFSDINMKNVNNILENKTSPKVLLYAGGLHVEYGIKRLVNAFIEVKIPGWELHIYGKGNYEEELNNICKYNNSISFFGSRPNNMIVKEQLKASILINPRPTDNEFVKYSFPSKTMECMASGTPLITTKLPSMPLEYLPYVYLITDETASGYAEALKRYLNIDAQDLFEFGNNAKQFILGEKNNVVQANKFYKFLKSF